MRSLSTGGRVWFVLTDRRVVNLLTIAYVGFGLAFVQTDYTMHDEGLLTHYWASWARQDFVPVFFLQKVKPVLCALYAPISAGGMRATLTAHVVMAATAIPLLAATARSLGHRFPNLPALMVALSPLYFYGGAAGFSNVDGVVGIAAVVYLLCACRLPFAAGLVAGFLPWVRFELAIFCAVIAVQALTSNRARPLLFGMMIFPLAYLCAGALYHHDALWIVRFPPSVPFDPNNPLWRAQSSGLQYVFEPVPVVTPLAALAVAVPLGRLKQVEGGLAAYAVLVAVTMSVLPIFHIGNFDTSPRYLLHLLPALALLVGRTLESWWDGERPGCAVLFGAALVGVWVATRQQDVHAARILLALYVLVLAAAWLRAGAFAVILAAVLALAGPLLPLRMNATRPVTAKYLDPMFAWLKAHPERSAHPIYTNAPLLGPFLARRLPGANVHYMAGTDVTRELTMLSNPANGQRDRLRRLCAVDFYGKTLLAPIVPEDLPADALLALRNDPRLALLLPDGTWSPRLELLVETPDYRIARLRPAAAAAQ